MASKGKNRRNKKGKESSGHPHAKVYENDAESTSMIEIDALKVENELLKEENVKLRTENEQLKEEAQKLKEAIGRVDRGTPENVMDVENTNSFEDLNVASQKPGKNGDTSGSNWESSRQKELLTEDTACALLPKRDSDEGSANAQIQSSWESEEQENSCSSYVKNEYRNNSRHGGSETLCDQEMEYGARKDKWSQRGREFNRNYGRSGRSNESRNTFDDDQNSYGRRGQEHRSGYRHNDQNANREQGHSSYCKYGDQDASNRKYEYTPTMSNRQQHWSNNRRSDQGSRRGIDKNFRSDNIRRENNQYGRSKEQSEKDKVNEIDGDLFSAPADYSLAHCVAADLRMGSGIAVQFKRQFKRVEELLGQRKKVGQVAILEDNGRYIYYLITKRYSTGKPRMCDLNESLVNMKEHAVKNNVKNIAIPRLGCGLDRLHWRDVRLLLNNIFDEVDVSITAYNFTVDSTSVPQDSTPKKSSIYVSDKLMKLVDIGPSTLLVLFGSECGHTDYAMKELDEKFRFIQDYKANSKKIGDVIELYKCNEMLCILIVKKHESDYISYPALHECLIKLRKIFKKEGYHYMGFTAFTDKDDDLTVAKIVTLLKVVFASIRGDVWICWPDELKYMYEECSFSHKSDV